MSIKNKKKIGTFLSLFTYFKQIKKVDNSMLQKHIKIKLKQENSKILSKISDKYKDRRILFLFQLLNFNKFSYDQIIVVFYHNLVWRLKEYEIFLKIQKKKILISFLIFCIKKKQNCSVKITPKNLIEKKFFSFFNLQDHKKGVRIFCVLNKILSVTFFFFFFLISKKLFIFGRFFSVLKRISVFQNNLRIRLGCALFHESNFFFRTKKFNKDIERTFSMKIRKKNQKK